MSVATVCGSAPRGRGAEEVVEGADRPAEERSGAAKEVALDALDVRAARHDEDRLAVDRCQVTLEQELDFPGVCRAGEQGQWHDDPS